MHMDYFLDRFYTKDRIFTHERRHMPRIMGIEHELDVLFYDHDGDPIDASPNGSANHICFHTLLDIVSDLSMTPDSRKNLGNGGRLILRNGGMAYRDMGTLLEICTPECTDPIEIVAYDKAIDLLLNDVLDAWNKLSKVKGLPGIKIFKKNTSIMPSNQITGQPHMSMPDFLSTRAFHENYRITRSLFDQLRYKEDKKPMHIKAQSWALFLAARYLFAGSGGIVPQQAASGEPDFLFAVSPRFMNIGGLHADGTTRRDQRSLINLRVDDSVEDESKSVYSRLHVICGDSHMLEKSLWLTVGVSSLVLELLESNDFDPTLAADLLDQNDGFITLIKKLAMNKEGTIKIKLVTGVRCTVRDILWRYYEMCRKYVEQNELWEHAQLLAEWKRALTLLERDPRELIGILDWPTLEWLIEEQMDSQGISSLSDAKIHETNFQFHDIDFRESTYYGLLESFERLTTDAEIRRALTTPPRTRAALRTKIVERLSELGYDFDATAWRTIKFTAKARESASEADWRCISLPDPCANDLSQLDEKSKAAIKRLGLL